MAYFPSYAKVIITTLVILLVSLSSSSALINDKPQLPPAHNDKPQLPKPQLPKPQLPPAHNDKPPLPQPQLPLPQPNDKQQLSPDFYKLSCPLLLPTVALAVRNAIANEARMGASLLRLHFHDCFVNGCDASILLDDIPGSFTGEKTAAPNNNSVRGFDVIDNIKAAVEAVCPATVSCADILAIVARDSVVQLGGPTWVVKLGRRDSLSASLAAANSGAIPVPTANLPNLTTTFNRQGLTIEDLVTLSGAHTIGLARCTNFRGRIYNDTNINSALATQRRAICPNASGSGDNNLAPLDLMTPLNFDNNYYKNLVNQNGLLHSDQELFNGGPTDPIVTKYSNLQLDFYSHFAQSMIKMGDISPLVGNQGQIRTNCRKRN